MAGYDEGSAQRSYSPDVVFSKGCADAGTIDAGGAGSSQKSCLRVIRRLPDRLEVSGLSSRSKKALQGIGKSPRILLGDMMAAFDLASDDVRRPILPDSHRISAQLLEVVLA